MSNENLIVKILLSSFQVFCGGSGKNHQQQQHYPPPQQQQQQQQYQQQGQYPGQYPPQNQWQQQQYPQGQPQSWSQVAGGQSPQHHPAQQHKPNGQYPSHQNGGYHSKPSIPAGGVVGPHHPQYQNQDQTNATNDRYQQLRNQARHEGDEAHRCFAASQDAYKSGDGARAHELSQQGKNHQKRQDESDDEAAGWIFNENNKQSPNGTIDLHGLYVKEAIERTEAAIAQGQRSGQEESRVIVGKGIHSQGHVAKIKPAVQDLMQKYNLSATVDPENSGVLIVNSSGRENHGRTRDAGGSVDQLDRAQGGDCVIM